MALSEAQREALERLLLKDRERLVRRIRRHSSFLNEDGGEHAFSFHMADQGTDMMEREKAFLRAADEGRQLRDIDAALRRLYRDPTSFGQCSNCGRDIDFLRLEAIPQASLCVDCKTLEESRE
ncbi:MAG TPA: TraR/DksA C4-type zinc finger protein [Longimicrobiales bacterium]|nr:TraR/DksA C4-type zinc finger protein [Longimicrobiales bacterium]